MNMTIKEMIERSAYSMDEFRPGWEREIDVTSLSIVDPQRCIMGQCFGDYSEMFDRFVVRFGESESKGFHCLSSHDSQYVEAWKEEIAYRIRNA
jgi:hypothetical protein